jgi:ribosomal protein S18 acetylase RimI-like enzyme
VTVAQVVIRRVAVEERVALARLVADRWGSTQIVSRGRLHDAGAAEAFVAVRGDEIVGSATFVVTGNEAELLTLDSFDEGAGIGGALVEAVAEAAASAHARQLVLSTTNDNVRALGFYQRRRFRLAELHPGAVDRARERKPSIPRVGSSGIPIRDELVLVRDLDT